MGLMNNCFRLYWDGIVEGTAHALLPGSWNSYRQWQKFIEPDMSSTVKRQEADPVGFYIPSVYQPPIAVGGGSWRPQGDGDLTGAPYAAMLGTFDFTGTGGLSGAGQKLLSGLLALTGTGTLTGSVTGQLNASFALTGTGDFAGDMAGIANALLDLVGSGDFEGQMNGVANASIDIVVTGTGLTTANVGQAVWAALAASNDVAGTMGEKLNDAGSAANPWTEVIENGKTAEEILRGIFSILKANGIVARFPSAGQPPAEFTFRDDADTKDRIVGTIDSDGNRTITDEDLT